LRALENALYENI